MWTKYTVSKAFSIYYKIVDTNTPALKKIVWFKVVRGTKSKTKVLLVRDGHIVGKSKRTDNVDLLNCVLQNALKPSIRAKGFGSLFKKYNVPKACRSILLKNSENPRNDILKRCISLNCLRDLLTVEQRMELCDKKHRHFLPRHVKMLSDFLKNIPRAKYVEHLAYPFIFDSLRFHGELAAKCDVNSITNWKLSPEQLHSFFYKEVERLSHLNVVIEYHECAISCIHAINEELVSSNLRVKLAQDTYEMVFWGQELNHCIGGYANEATCGNSLFFGVYEGETLLYTIQSTKDFAIRQFYGKYNCLPTQEHGSLVRGAVSKIRYM